MCQDVEVLDLAPSRPAAGTPVFVDGSGSRSRRVALAGRVLATGTLAYLVLVVASLVGAPWVPRLALPTVGPTPRTVHAAPAVTLPATAQRQATPRLTKVSAPQAPNGAATTVAPAVGSTARTTPVGAVPATTALAPGQVRGSPSTTVAATTATTTTAPGHSGTAPRKHP